MKTITKQTLSSFLPFLLACLSMSAYAGTYTLLIPHDFTRGSGTPVTETVNFPAVDTASSYTLNVYNGGLVDDTSTGEYVSSSVISVNGTQVLGPSEFNQNTATATAQVSLQTSNTLSITLYGKPGGLVTVEILGEESQPPVITASVSPTANANGWHNADPTVTFTCTDAISGVASCPDPVTVSTEGANQSVSGTATDNAGNTASTSVTINLDKTAPSVTAQPGSPANASGWHNNDVTVNFTCTDGLSGIAACSDPVTVSTEGASQSVSGSGSDIAGNSATASLPLNIDKTAPTITASASPAAGANGWNTSDVTVSFSCNDGLSGVISCPDPVTVSTEGASQSVSGTTTDSAGNTASTSVSINLDKTAPTLSITSPAAGSTTSGNQPSIDISYGDNLGIDTGSLVLTVNGQPLTVTCQSTATSATCTPSSALPSGSIDLAATITDTAGLTATASSTFTIGSTTAGTTTTQTSYNAQGLVASVDGPRTDVEDVTTYTYYTDTTTDHHPGDRHTVTDALGYVTTFLRYDADGRPLAIVDANGIETDMAYDARGRLLTRTVAAGTAEGATTNFEYDGVGNIIKTTLPNGSYLQNTYDAAERLIAVEDNLGNRIEYTLDSMGNRTKEDVRDPQGILTRSLSRTYNDLNRLTQTVGGAGQTTTFAYDANGNRIDATVDPSGLNQATTQAFDALNRLVSTTDAANGVTSYTYDARGNLTSVTDPRGLTTAYTYDGLDRLIQRTSPDTGTTTYTYDAAGNRTSQSDARGITTQFTYDALNRLTAITYPDTSQNVAYTYDNCPNGIGRLCAMQDESGTTSYAYDARGNIVTKTTIRDGITQTLAYAYNKADQLTQITYPDGRTVDYSRNILGQVTDVTTTAGGNTVSLAGNVGYEPFGPVKAMSYGNGINRTQDYDQDYRLTAITSGILDRGYTHDAANNVTAITNNLDNSRSQTFSYDNLNRLTDAGGIYGAFTYTYDADGNRLTKSTAGGVDGYTYDTASNRLLQVQDSSTRDYQYDASGNTVDNTDHQFVYGDNNRLQEAQTSGLTLAAYTYNGRGERVKKVATAITYYQYSEQGPLLAETDGAGNTLREYVYLNGRPLALIQGSNIYIVHSDHLGIPQAITDQNQQMVWKADYEPFGEATITGSSITYNLRFPGQYYDQETNIFNNYMREYDSNIGRYIESDPLGINGGHNTYGYVFQNPLKSVDPTGLVKWTGARLTVNYGFALGGIANLFLLTSECKCGKKINVSVTASALGIVFGGGATGGSVKLHDNEKCPDPIVFNGVYVEGWANGAIGPIGGGFGYLILGGEANNFPSNIPFSGDIFAAIRGLGISAGTVFGASGVLGFNEVPCEDCEKN